jgi:hypothetical protein
MARRYTITAVCVLICRVGPDALLGANRDEHYDRPFSGVRRWDADDPGGPAVSPAVSPAGDTAFWAPRDDTEGGTWIGINERGLVAAITNLSREKAEEGRASRGHLVAGCLGRADLADARRFLDTELSGAARNPCQILLMQGERAEVCVIQPGGHHWEVLDPGVHVLSNLHDTDEIRFELSEGFNLADLRPLLSDRRKSLPRDFAVNKDAGWRGTVASTLIDPGKELWFAGGKPDEVEYERFADYPGG